MKRTGKLPWWSRRVNPRRRQWLAVELWKSTEVDIRQMLDADSVPGFYRVKVGEQFIGSVREG